MKKLLPIMILLFLFAFTSYAQRTYSKQNLEQVSPDELNILLEKAKKNKTVGWVSTIVGSVSVTSVFVFNDNMDFDTIGILFFGGSASVLMGLPVLIVNSSRVNKIKNTLSDRVSIEIAPCRFHNNFAQSNHNGVTLRVSF